MSAVDVQLLHAASKRLGDAVVDPSVWPDVMGQICRAVNARGAALLQGGVRTPDIPRTEAVVETFNSYFADGWHTRDLRAIRGVPLLLRGAKVVVDQDLVTPEEMRRADFYRDFVESTGNNWFAGVGFWGGSELWGLAIQRTRRQGPFDAPEKEMLAPLSDRLTETATLSVAVGRVALSGMTNALNLVSKPALVLDRMGNVVDANAAAESLFDENLHVRGRRLAARNKNTRADLDTFLDRLRTTPDTVAFSAGPLVVRREGKRPVIVRVLPIDGAARNCFLGARALLVLSDLERTPRPEADVIRRAFGLTRAEAKLAQGLAAGASLEAAAKESGVSYETARRHLKDVFSKTDTHRQSELLALLSRL